MIGSLRVLLAFRDAELARSPRTQTANSDREMSSWQPFRRLIAEQRAGSYSVVVSRACIQI
jgi:hypothetical protein